MLAYESTNAIECLHLRQRLLKVNGLLLVQYPFFIFCQVGLAKIEPVEYWIRSSQLDWLDF
jgi:hypothetical protein